MANSQGRVHLPSLLAGLWLTFSVSLAAWWLIFGLQQIDRIKAIQHESAVTQDLIRQSRMVIWEGSFLILCLIAGGVALMYYIHRENVRHQEIKEFFATFTHEIKTSLASLRLQTESLEEDLKGSGGPEKLLSRLVQDSVRLELQLENSLFLAHGDASQMILKPLDFVRAVDSMRRHWPSLKIRVSGEATVLADERALESVLKNLIQNSLVHGQASEITMLIENRGGRVVVSIEDNGGGFSGARSDLGKLFRRHYTKSGSGVGLYLARRLMREMRGELDFQESTSGGFRVQLVVPEARA